VSEQDIDLRKLRYFLAVERWVTDLRAFGC
jgi:hypothetical protein